MRFLVLFRYLMLITSFSVAGWEEADIGGTDHTVPLQNMTDLHLLYPFCDGFFPNLPQERLSIVKVPQKESRPDDAGPEFKEKRGSLGKEKKKKDTIPEVDLPWSFFDAVPKKQMAHARSHAHYKKTGQYKLDKKWLGFINRLTDASLGHSFHHKNHRNRLYNSIAGRFRSWLRSRPDLKKYRPEYEDVFLRFHRSGRPGRSNLVLIEPDPNKKMRNLRFSF